MMWCWSRSRHRNDGARLCAKHQTQHVETPYPLGAFEPTSPAPVSEGLRGEGELFCGTLPGVFAALKRMLRQGLPQLKLRRWRPHPFGHRLHYAHHSDDARPSGRFILSPLRNRRFSGTRGTVRPSQFLFRLLCPRAREFPPLKNGRATTKYCVPRFYEKVGHDACSRVLN